MLNATILVGDAVERLQTIGGGSVQTCVTSPPYFGLRDYGQESQIGLESSVDEYVDALVRVFDEVARVLTEDGTLWLNLGDSYANGGMSNPSAKSTLSGGKDRGAADYSIARKIPAGLKPKDLIGIPWRVAFALQAQGWYLRSDIIWHKPNPMPESVTDRPTKSHETIFLLSKQERYFYDAEAIKEDSVTKDIRRPYGSQGANILDKRSAQGEGKQRKNTNGNFRNKRSVWTVPVSSYKGAHFATYPPALIKPCVLAGSREGDTVLDPFSGSGTTGEVALLHNRNYVGTELNPEYADISVNRITNAIGMLGQVTLERE
jgi:DNA modification methylase